MPKAASDLQRVAFSPAEFAKLFGKEQTWAYRQLYGGKVKAVTENGRIMIPASEVDKILSKAGVYDGMKKKPSTKAEVEKLSHLLPTAWGRYLEHWRENGNNHGKAGAASKNRSGLPWMRRPASSSKMPWQR